MTDFLNIAGVTVPVVQDGSTKMEKPQKVGKSGRTFAGNLRSTQRITKRVWSFNTANMSLSTMLSLMTNAPDGNFATCTGYAFSAAGATNITCEVNYGGGGFEIDSLGFVVTNLITLVEV